MQSCESERVLVVIPGSLGLGLGFNEYHVPIELCSLFEDLKETLTEFKFKETSRSVDIVSQQKVSSIKSDRSTNYKKTKAIEAAIHDHVLEHVLMTMECICS